MDRLEAMAMLVAVTERGSLSAAARALNVPLPTLSRKITELETHLGARLLTRSTRKLSLTDAGTSYLAAARRILEAVGEAEREAAGEFSQPVGELVISAPLMFGRLHVLPVVTDFLEQYPDVSIRLFLTDRNVHLLEDGVDMAVRIGALPDSSMVATRLGSMSVVSCMSPTLVAQLGAPTTPTELPRWPCIALEGPLPISEWSFRSKPGAAVMQTVPIRPRLSVTSTEAAAQAAISGTGVTRLLFYQVVDAARAGALRIILENYEPDPLPVSFLHATRGQMPLKLRRFLDFAAPRLRQALQDLSEVRRTLQPAS